MEDRADSGHDRIDGTKNLTGRVPMLAGRGSLSVFAGICLVVALVSSAMLVVQHLGGLSLPGCGPASACADLTAGRWGSILGVPVSIVGLSYFAGLLAASATSGGWYRDWGVCRGVAAVTVAGALGSLFFTAVMIHEQTWCGYCLATHLANFGLTASVIGLAMRSSLSESPSLGSGSTTGSGKTWIESSTNSQPVMRWLGLFSGCFLLTLVGLVAVSRGRREQVAEQHRQLAGASIDRVLATAELDATRSEPPPDGGFTGRHRRGPEQAVARLVVFLDYQCPDCCRLETELGQLVDQSELVSLTLRHFPMCAECNPSIKYRWFHPNACQAARVAEAAGVLGGDPAFFQAHDWLVEREGTFETDDLAPLAESLGVSMSELTESMASPQVTQRLERDLHEGRVLGVESTPFVFLNGSEIRGAAGDPTHVLGAVEQLLTAHRERLAAGRLSPLRSAAWDRQPQGAGERMVAGWKLAEPHSTLPSRDDCVVVLGNGDADKRVILFLDPTYDDAGGMWRMLNRLALDRDDVRVEFYLYPMGSELNERFAGNRVTLFPDSTAATKLAFAVREFLGVDAFRHAFSVLIASTPDERLSKVAEVCGMSASELEEAMESGEVSAAIDRELAIAERCGVSWGPTLIIGGRPSPSDLVTAEQVGMMLDATQE